jgi:glycosyltransferase involved in cell wall biosynthesis
MVENNSACETSNQNLTKCSRISLIMPARNEGKYLQKSIDSLYENTSYPDYEVLIMDDASNDGCCDFLSGDPYASDPRLRLLRTKEQKGHVALRIEAVRRSTGSVLQFLDAHHWFGPHWLTNLHNSLSRRNFNAVVGPVVRPIDTHTWQPTTAVSHGFGIDATLARCWYLNSDEIDGDGRVDWLAGHQIMMTREAYETIGGICPLFRGHGADDIDLCLRAYLIGYECFIEPTSTIGHLYKSGHINPVTSADVQCNYFIIAYLNLGEERFEELKVTRKNEQGYAGALQMFERLRPDVEEFRNWIMKHRSRTGAELSSRLTRCCDPSRSFSL